MILAMPKKITLENLAAMVQEGFAFFATKFDAIDRRFEDLENKMNKKFDEIDKRFDSIDDRLDIIDMRLDKIEGRLDNIEHVILKDHLGRIVRIEEQVFAKKV